MCREALDKGRETVVIVDNLNGQTTNLNGQTTTDFANELKKNKCKRHLLPTGVTGEFQLINDGVGMAVKRQMGTAFDLWTMDDSNLERWIADKSSDPNITPLDPSCLGEADARYSARCEGLRLGRRYMTFLILKGQPRVRHAGDRGWNR